MIELYLFITALLAIVIIVMRRHFIFERTRKSEFRQKISSWLDHLKKEERNAPSKRFRDTLNEEQKRPKWHFAHYADLMRKAEVMIAKQEWKEAKPLLIQALALTEDEVPVSLKLAEAYRESGDLRKAETLYERLLELNPENPKIYEELAKIHLKKKQYKESIRHYARALELNEKDEELLLGLGKLYFLLMRYSLAAECFRRAAELRPREVSTLFLLADCCAADEDFENALFTYEKILTLEPYNEKAEQAAQEVRIKMKETEQMIQKVMEQKSTGMTSLRS